MYSAIGPIFVELYFQTHVAIVQLSFMAKALSVFGIIMWALVVSGENETTRDDPLPTRQNLIKVNAL